MDYSQEFVDRLNSGEVMLRKIWPNQNSKIGSFAAQYMQSIDTDEVDPTRSVLAASLGFTPGQRVTAILTISPKKLQESGLALEETTFCFDGDETLSAEELLGIPVDIDVVENTEKNPLQPMQEPKINPTTSEVLTHKGKPIYRHTQLVAKGRARQEFLAHDVAAPTVGEKRDVVKSMERDLDKA